MRSSVNFETKKLISEVKDTIAKIDRNFDSFVFFIKYFSLQKIGRNFNPIALFVEQRLQSSNPMRVRSVPAFEWTKYEFVTGKGRFCYRELLF